MTQAQTKQQSMQDFGAAGWGIILYCLLMFFFYVGMINDGTNVLAPTAAANIGVEPGTVIETTALPAWLPCSASFWSGKSTRSTARA